ncbi:iron-siderophore ABC transporter substrate-binding protein [Microlunatus capsulatus]|uniref:Iron complex transport system substrate-binding protein n=1 Tax=Microlunatus capsulatus TaxID=99117 RepID=A0ABS4ZCM6_9ACTN|nr:iron-siderophore ABC transporter substrate-binding protein [Microlunatus capsulatus]MBP2417913.1 iron complex transport system substrate-binding protein [Microlunatus capsulatus]
MPRTTPLRALRRPLAALVPLLLLVVAGCSSSTPEAAEPAASASGAADAAFPVTLEHQFGSTTIPAAPQRVVTVGFNEQDYALAFGVEPVGVREFLGYDAPNRPWAPEGVRGKDIPTLGSQDLEFEKIAGLAPDLILGINSYIDQAAYDKLAAIAPTVAQSADVAPGATTWQDQTLTTGKALGRDADAQALVERTEKAFTDAVAANASFAGKSAGFALGSSDAGTYSLGADDYRTGWLTELGFTVPEKGGEVSFERLDVLDADVLLVEGFEQKALDNKLFAALPAVQDGRLVNLGQFDQDFAAALGFNSPLSIPFLLDIAVPRLAAATDGDASTTPEAYTG